MKYQKVIYLVDKALNHPSKLMTKKWVEINAHGTYNTNSQTKFKTAMLKTSLYNYSNAYILVKGIYNSCKHFSCSRSRKKHK